MEAKLGRPPLNNFERVGMVVVDGQWIFPGRQPHKRCAKLGMCMGRGFIDTDSVCGNEFIIAAWGLLTSKYPHLKPLWKNMSVYYGYADSSRRGIGVYWTHKHMSNALICQNIFEHKCEVHGTLDKNYDTSYVLDFICQIDQLHRENDELRTQLARCRSINKSEETE